MKANDVSLALPQERNFSISEKEIKLQKIAYNNKRNHFETEN